MIIADPALIAVTSPEPFTVATPALLELYVTFLLVALDGRMVGVNCCVPPTANVADVGLRLTLVTATFEVFTVITAVAVLEPSWVVTVIVADPTATAVINPLPLTVAIDELLVL